MGIDDACGNVSCPHIDPAKALSRHDRVNHIEDAYGILNNVSCGIPIHYNFSEANSPKPALVNSIGPQ